MCHPSGSLAHRNILLRVAGSSNLMRSSLLLHPCPKQHREHRGQQKPHLPHHPGQRPGRPDDAEDAPGRICPVEERVGPSADHDPLGQPRDEAAAHHGQDQRQGRRDAGEVQPGGRRGSSTSRLHHFTAFNNAQTPRYRIDKSKDAAEGPCFVITRQVNGSAP